MASLVSSDTLLLLMKYSAAAMIGILAGNCAASLVYFYQFVKFNKIIGHPANAAFKPSDLSIQKGRQAACTGFPKRSAFGKPRERFSGGYSFGGNPSLILQYWRSHEHLIAYARNPNQKHFPAWAKVRRYWIKTREQSGTAAFGLYHETFRVRAGGYEAIYDDMPAYGLGRIFGLVEAKGRYKSAKSRLGLPEGSDAPQWEPVAPAEKVATYGDAPAPDTSTKEE
eukprot:jgi/Botrbrau1/6151/Bobra.331_2s0041.1